MTAADSGLVTFVDSSAGGVTITLPAAATISKSTYIIVAYASSSNAIILLPDPDDYIVGLGDDGVPEKARILASPKQGDYIIIHNSDLTVDATCSFIQEAQGGWTVEP